MEFFIVSLTVILISSNDFGSVIDEKLHTPFFTSLMPIPTSLVVLTCSIS